MVRSFYKNDYRPFKKGQDLPRVSTSLDSIRTYQFECQFFGLPPSINNTQRTDLTLAAKQVGAISMAVEPIKVNRVNDVIHYPGLPSFESITITFDNLVLKRTTGALWEWFKATYDPITGDLTKFSAPGGAGNNTFKAIKLRIIELDNTRTPHSAIELYGVYVEKIEFSEKNYSTNEFSNVAATFRFDFMDYFNY